MVSEDFSFPKISNPLPQFTSLPSLWRVTSLVYPEFGDDNNEENEQEPVNFQMNQTNDDDDEGEKMDMLWEELEFNEEPKKDSSLGSKKEAHAHAMMKIYHKKQSKSLLAVTKSLKIKMFCLRRLAWLKK